MSQLEKLYAQDLLVWLPDNRYDYALVTLPISNNTSASRTVSEVIGMPVVYDGATAELVLNASVANVNAIVVGVCDGAPNEVTVADGDDTPDKYMILVRGPALVNKSKIALADPAGTTYTAATVISGLADELIHLASEPLAAHTTTQGGY